MPVLLPAESLIQSASRSCCEILRREEPDKIEAAQRMLALTWRCDNCGYITNSKVPIKIPAPCVQCGGTVFRVVNR